MISLDMKLQINLYFRIQEKPKSTSYKVD